MKSKAVAAIMPTMATILRSIAIPPVGGPAGASGTGWETRAAYHSTAARMASSTPAKRTAGTLKSIGVVSRVLAAQAGAGVAWSVEATERETALVGPVSTVILPV